MVEYLRSATRLHHNALDRDLVPIIKSVSDSLDYQYLLGMFYSFYYPVELKLDHFLNEVTIYDYPIRRRAARIMNDIRSIGSGEASFQFCSDLPGIFNLETALGAYYVLEGSTMGGGVICKMLGENAGIVKGLSFFAAYGQDNHRMWNNFLNQLESLSSMLNHREVIGAAVETFIKLHDWTKEFYGKENIRTAS